MDRRAFLCTVAGGLLAAPLAAEAQPVSKVWHIGFVGAEAYSTNWQFLDAFRLGMQEHGYVEGKNINIEARWAEGRTERFHDLVAELIRLQLEVGEEGKIWVQSEVGRGSTFTFTLPMRPWPAS